MIILQHAKVIFILGSRYGLPILTKNLLWYLMVALSIVLGVATDVDSNNYHFIATVYILMCKAELRSCQKCMSQY